MYNERCRYNEQCRPLSGAETPTLAKESSIVSPRLTLNQNQFNTQAKSIYQTTKNITVNVIQLCYPPSGRVGA